MYKLLVFFLLLIYNVIVMIMIIILILLICLFILWSFLMVRNRFKDIDTKVYERINIKNFKTFILKIITSLASTRFFVILSILLLIILRNRKAVALVVFLALNGIINEILKRLFKRERPNIKRLVVEKGYSYPSGHTMSATCFYGLMSFLVAISELTIYFKIGIIVLLVLLVLVIGFSRIYLGVHYFSDVVAGILMGTFFTILYVQLVQGILNIFCVF